MKMNIAITILVLLLVFCLIAQPTSITLHPFKIEFNHFGYGLGIILIIIGCLSIHAESRLNAIKDYTESVKEALRKGLNLTEEEFESVWNGEKTINEIKETDNGNQHHNKD